MQFEDFVLSNRAAIEAVFEKADKKEQLLKSLHIAVNRKNTLLDEKQAITCQLLAIQKDIDGIKKALAEL